MRQVEKHRKAKESEPTRAVESMRYWIELKKKRVPAVQKIPVERGDKEEGVECEFRSFRR